MVERERDAPCRVLKKRKTKAERGRAQDRKRKRNNGRRATHPW